MISGYVPPDFGNFSPKIPKRPEDGISFESHHSIGEKSGFILGINDTCPTHGAWLLAKRLMLSEPPIPVDEFLRSPKIEKKHLE